MLATSGNQREERRGAGHGKGRRGGNRPMSDRPSVFDEGRAMPMLIVRESALHANLAAMRDYCAANGVAQAPHAKTHMSPELWRLQESYGAQVCTLATVAQVAAFAAHGVRRFLIANEVVDPGDLAQLTTLRRDLADFEVSVFVDSVEGVSRMTAVLAETADDLPQLPVLVEFGAPGWRAGARTEKEVLAVADAVAASGLLTLVGFAGYEGVLSALSGSARNDAVNSYLTSASAAIRTLLDRRDLSGDAILTFGGSDLYPAVVDLLPQALPGLTILLRSGCYLVHDHGKYELAQREVPAHAQKPHFTSALEVWAPVLSVPEPGIAIVGLGRRDVSFDESLPIAIAVRPTADRCERSIASGLLPAKRLYDQHIVLDTRRYRLRVGDLVGFGISHPCMTFDRWRSGLIVDDDSRVTGEFSTAFP
jgi:D-serine dehydratase